MKSLDVVTGDWIDIVLDKLSVEVVLHWVGLALLSEVFGAAVLVHSSTQTNFEEVMREFRMRQA